MRIIALQGKHDTGKTTTLNKLIDLLENHEFFCCEKILDEGGGDGERRCWATSSGVKIGITTRGDAEECLYADFFGKPPNFKDRDIVVCAIRTYGGTETFVRKYGNDGLLIHGRWYLEGSQDMDIKRSYTHQAQAEAILEEIMDYIKEREASQ